MFMIPIKRYNKQITQSPPQAHFLQNKYTNEQVLYGNQSSMKKCIWRNAFQVLSKEFVLKMLVQVLSKGFCYSMPKV